jgi:hypothetical protein
MRNYRRLSGGGSVKVVLSGDSNSPPNTTSEREPPPYNSSPTQQVCPGVACTSRVRVAEPSQCHILPSFPTTDNGQPATDQPANVDSGTSHFILSKTPAIPAFSQALTSTSHQKVDCFPLDLPLGNSLVIRFWALVIPGCAGLYLQKNNFSSCPLCVLGGFVVKGSFHPKFQKKPVFARIRGLCDSHPARKNVDFRVPQSPSSKPSVVSSNKASLQNNFSSCSLCELRVSVVNGSSNLNRSKKP